MTPAAPISSPTLSPLLACLVGALMLASGDSAWAQWQWRDATGQRVFSDTPPPPGVAERDILKRPGGRPAASDATAPPPAATPPAQKSSAAGTGGDAQLEGRKQQLEKAEADKRKAEEKAAEEKAAKARAQNCENARRNKAALASGVRLSMPNAKGEAEFLDEAARAAQMRQAEAVIRENCR